MVVVEAGVGSVGVGSIGVVEAAPGFTVDGLLVVWSLLEHEAVTTTSTQLTTNPAWRVNVRRW